MHLYISTGRTFMTVFHNDDDDKVIYDGDSVSVDGRQVIFRFMARPLPPQ